MREALSGVEGIARVVGPDAYGALGLPTPDESDQAGDLVLVAADGYAFSGAADGEVVVEAALGGLGAHGYLNSDPEMTALFVASGRGIRRGARLGLLEAPDVGAIVAALLGIEMGAIDGSVPAGLFDTGG